MEDDSLGPGGQPRVDLAADGSRGTPHLVASARREADVFAEDPGLARDKIDFLWRTRDAHDAAIRFADTKAGAALVLASAAAGWASGAAGAISQVAPPWRPAIFLLLAATFACFFTTLAFVALTIRPRRVGESSGAGAPPALGGLLRDMRLSRRPERAAGGSPGLVFFGDVARYEESAAYMKELSRIEAAGLALQVGRDAWRSARLCERKYAWVGGSVWWSACTALGSMLTLLALALGRV